MYIQPDEPIHHNVVVYAHKEGKKFEWHHILGVVLGFIGFIAIIILLIKRCLSRRRYRATGKVIRRNRKQSPDIFPEQKGNPCPALQIEPPVYTTQNSIYLVPFSALPPNFDFAASGVEVKSDYVIVKDLHILNIYGAICHRSLEEYQRPLPYNPNFR
nr:unnamed protein product [Callosobruchus chinensis]